MVTDDVTVPILWTVTEDTVTLGDAKWRDVEKVKFLDHPVVLNCVEGGAEVNKKV